MNICFLLLNKWEMNATIKFVQEKLFALHDINMGSLKLYKGIITAENFAACRINCTRVRRNTPKLWGIPKDVQLGSQNFYTILKE